MASETKPLSEAELTTLCEPTHTDTLIGWPVVRGFDLRRTLATLDAERAETQRLSGIEWKQPDGLTVDPDGRLWRSTPNGKRACTREEVVGVLNALETARLAAKGPDAGEGQP